MAALLVLSQAQRREVSEMWGWLVVSWIEDDLPYGPHRAWRFDHELVQRMLLGLQDRVARPVPLAWGWLEWLWCDTDMSPVARRDGLGALDLG